jgi:hypothetical protein
MLVGLLAKSGEFGLRMPREADGLGTTYEGVVLSGKVSVDERREAEVAEILKRKVDVEKYGELTDYDPVLRWHCRLD